MLRSAVLSPFPCHQGTHASFILKQDARSLQMVYHLLHAVSARCREVEGCGRVAGTCSNVPGAIRRWAVGGAFDCPSLMADVFERKGAFWTRIASFLRGGSALPDATAAGAPSNANAEHIEGLEREDATATAVFCIGGSKNTVYFSGANVMRLLCCSSHCHSPLM